MKKYVFAILLSLYISTTRSQYLSSPVKWIVKAEQLKAGHYRVIITAKLDKDWHIYAQKQPADAIGIPIAFHFTSQKGVILGKSVQEHGEIQKQLLPELGITQYFYANSVDFIKDVYVEEDDPKELSFSVTYMVCSGTTCMPEKTESFKCEIK